MRSSLLALALAGCARSPAAVSAPPQDAAAQALRPLADLAAGLEAGLMRVIGGAPVEEAFAPWSAALSGPSGEAALAQLRSAGIREVRVGMLEWEIVLGADGPRQSLRTIADPGGPGFLRFEVRPEDSLGRAAPAAEWTGDLAPLGQAAEALAAAAQGAGCLALPLADPAAMRARLGLDLAAFPADIAAMAPSRQAACAALAGGQDRALGARLDDFAWFLLDDTGALIGVFKGELEVLGPGQLGVALGDPFQPLP